MYKTRMLSIVVAIVIIALTFLPIPKFFVAPADGITLNTYYLDTKKSVQDELVGFNGLLRMHGVTIDLADTLITTRNKQNIPDKFSNLNSITICYSPVVMGVPKSALEDAGKYFVTSENDSGKPVYKKSLKNILIKLADSTKEKGVSSTDIEVSGDSSYKLIIPGTESPYRKVVIDTIILELLDGKEPTKDNINEVRAILDKVIANSYTTLDIGGVLNEIKNSSYIILFPEHLLESRNNSINVVYSDNVACEQVYMYYSKGIEENIEGFVEDIRKEPALLHSFGYSTGYRVSGLKQNQFSPYEYTADNVNNTVAPESLSRLMGDNYWK